MTMTGTAAARDGALAPVVAHLRAHGIARFGWTSADVAVLERISRPYSEIARARLSPAGRPADADGVIAYLKVFTPREQTADALRITRQRVADDFATNSRLHEALSKADDLAVPTPLVCLPEHLALVVEEAPGLTLLKMAERDARFTTAPASLAGLTTGLTRVGRWLAVFQHTGPESPPFAIDSLLEYLDVRLKRLVDHPGSDFSGADRTRVIAAIRRRWDGVPTSDLSTVPVHADMALGNVLVAPDRVTVIDLAMVSSGCRYHDLAHLYMQLGLLAAKPTFRPRAVRLLQDALLRGYDEALSASAPLFEILHCQHVACHMSALLRGPAGPVERLYNRWLVHRHLRWLRQFSAGA